jgi:hypothetical protein
LIVNDLKSMLDFIPQWNELIIIQKWLAARKYFTTPP